MATPQKAVCALEHAERCFHISVCVLLPQSDLLTPLIYRLKESDLQLRFCTNETQAAREAFVAKLHRLGFDMSVSEVFPPAPAAVAVLKERGLRPHLLLYDGNAV